jgi:hypothetical protein
MLRLIAAWLLCLLTVTAQAQNPNTVIASPVYGNTTVATYSAAAGMAASATGDVYCITGSTTRTVHVKGIRISAVASGTAATVALTLNKYSTAPTGGTTVATSIIPSDSANAPATATVTAYTTAPTSGTLVGKIRSQYVAAPIPASAVVSNPALFQFSVYWDQPVILHGAETLCVNSAPISAGAGSWSIDHEHVEF